MEDPQLRVACERYVVEQGGAEFFARRNWRRTLDRFTASYRQRHGDRGRFETDAEREEVLWRELADSKQRIERELPGKRIEHLCFPWDSGSELAIALSGRAGYLTTCVGVAPFRGMGVVPGTPTRISRFSEDWFFTLPGAGRRSFLDPVRMKVARWLQLPRTGVAVEADANLTSALAGARR